MMVTVENGRRLQAPRRGIVHVYCWDLFSRAPDGAQMQINWRKTDLSGCLYWPDFLALPL